MEESDKVEVDDGEGAAGVDLINFDKRDDESCAFGPLGVLRWVALEADLTVELDFKFWAVG